MSELVSPDGPRNLPLAVPVQLLECQAGRREATAEPHMATDVRSAGRAAEEQPGHLEPADSSPVERLSHPGGHVSTQVTDELAIDLGTESVVLVAVPRLPAASDNRRRAVALVTDGAPDGAQRVGVARLAGDVLALRTPRNQRNLRTGAGLSSGRYWARTRWAG